MRNLCVVLICLISMLGVGGEVSGQVNHWYSNDLDEIDDGAGGHNGLSPGAVLFTTSPDVPGVPNPVLSRFLGPGQIDLDALANEYDLMQSGVILNADDLLISFVGDPVGDAVHYETPTGVVGVAYTQVDFCNPNPAGNLDDVDGLDMWQGPWNYSEVGDPGGTSVWNGSMGGPFITHAEIVLAVQNLGYTGPDSIVDVDGLMVGDWNGTGYWDQDDVVLFSIRDTRPAGNFDGGELIVMNPTALASFLNHGGHVWDTAFPVAATFGVNTEDIDAIEARETTAQVGKQEAGFSGFTLAQNEPNPFGSTTTIRFTLPEAGRVHLAVYDVTGRRVRTLVNRRFDDPSGSAVWDGCDDRGREVPSGVYFCRLELNSEYSMTRKMVRGR